MATTAKKKRGKLPPSAQTGTSAASNPLISDQKLKQLYSTMLQCQLLHEPTHRLNRTRNKTVPLAGGEAVAVGTAIDLRRDDWLAPFASEEIGKLIKGVPLGSILSSPRSGKPATRSGNKIAADPLDAVPLKEEPSLFHILPRGANPVAELNLVSGIALTLQAKKTGNVAMAFFGDISGAGQRWYEALAFAGRHCLPLLVVVHNKAASKLASPTKGHPFVSLLSEGSACEVPVIPVDADDVVAVYRVACESIHKARHGGGPTLIQAVPLPASLSSSDARAHSGDRADAIVRMEDRLATKGLFSANWKQRLVDDFNQRVDDVAGTASKPRLRGR